MGFSFDIFFFFDLVYVDVWCAWVDIGTSIAVLGSII